MEGHADFRGRGDQGDLSGGADCCGNATAQATTRRDVHSMSAQLDLKPLAVDRGGEAKPPLGPRRRLATRYLLPASLLLAFAALVLWATGVSLLPAKDVTVVPVLVSRAEVQNEGTPLFQAAGWVEPRPTPTLVSAQAEGVIEKLLVVEGQEVTADQAVAQLIDTDTRLGLRKAEAEVQLREADLETAHAALLNAQTNLERPVQLQSEVAEAQSQLAKIRSDMAELPFAVKGAEARVTLAQEIVEGKKQAGDAIPGRSLQKAQAELESARQALAELSAREPSLKEQVASLERKHRAAQERLELKADERRRLSEGQAGVKAAEARLRQAQLAVETEQLRLKRMTLRAGMAGRVLAVLVKPGDRVMGLDPQSGRDASNVLALYDPEMLQLRVDVRLEDVPQVTPGQAVRVETAAVPGGLDAEVLRATSQADIQKNTLQVKVAIKSPPPVLKPEMLVQATFLAPARPKEPTKPGEEPLRLLVPRQLVVRAENDTFVWVAERESSRARKRTVRLGAAGTEELIEIVQGLCATDKLIVSGREGLADGARIKVLSEEPPGRDLPRTTGATTSRTAAKSADSISK
jgi:RND family efflux transporter MFP subunit